LDHHTYPTVLNVIGSLWDGRSNADYLQAGTVAFVGRTCLLGDV